jgi:hypothetical protein
MPTRASGFWIVVAAALIVSSCSAKPDYDEELRTDVDRWFKELQEKVEVTKLLPEGSLFKDYEGTWLDMTDNRDVNKNFPHTPFVTRYDPETKVNVGPGHVPKKTKWCPLCEAEVSNDPQKYHLHWKDSETQKDKWTHWSYYAEREVGPDYCFKKTEFDYAKNVLREKDPTLYEAGKTRWDKVYRQEVGVDFFDPDFSKYCPRCRMNVAEFGHEQKGALHYGHQCDLTGYSKIWLVDMFLKDPKVYEKIPASKTDYVELDKTYAPNRQPRIFEPEPDKVELERDPEHTMPGVSWVEDRSVILERDDLDRIDQMLKNPEVLWKWNSEESKKRTIELSGRKVLDVAQDVIDWIQKIREPEYKWTKAKEEE